MKRLPAVVSLLLAVRFAPRAKAVPAETKDPVLETQFLRQNCGTRRNRSGGCSESAIEGRRIDTDDSHEWKE